MAAKDLYEKDLYSILGVKKSDDAAAVKKQYRKLARELHPDKTKGDKKLEEKFKSVSEAYEVLSDDKKRAEYDEMREAFKGGRVPQGGGNFGGGFQGADFSDLFGGGSQDIFGTIFGAGHGPRRGQDLAAATTISFRDSIYGTELDLKLAPQGGKANSVTTRIPGGINGRTLRIKSRGVKTARGTGDLLITIEIQVPQRVDGKAREALEAFAKATEEFDPRLDLAQKARA